MSRWAILNEYKLTINIIEGERLEGLRLPLGQAIINIDNFNVAIGDSYEGGIWHNVDGDVEPKLSAEQEIAILKADKVAMQEVLDGLLLAQLEGGMV